MNQLTRDELNSFIEEKISAFHDEKIKKIKGLKLDSLLKKKNPYLFKTKNLNNAEEFIRALLEASLSSSEETKIGNLLEQLAIFINEKEFGGQKSTTKGVDLEFVKEGVRYLVSIKSGPHWGNASQIKIMQDYFTSALKTARTSGGQGRIECVEGCSYGRESVDRGNYRKICGQAFWEFISGDAALYKDLIESFGVRAGEKNREFKNLYAETVESFSKSFSERFARDGRIDWEALIEFNSGAG